MLKSSILSTACCIKHLLEHSHVCKPHITLRVCLHKSLVSSNRIEGCRSSIESYIV